MIKISRKKKILSRVLGYGSVAIAISRVLGYGSVAIATLSIPLIFEVPPQIDSRIVRPINSTKYQSVTVNNLADIEYEGKLVSIYNPELIESYYTTNENSINLAKLLYQWGSTLEERRNTLNNRIDIMIRDRNSRVSKNENTLHCYFQSNGATDRYKYLDSILGDGKNYKSPLVLRGRVFNNSGYGDDYIPGIFGHSIDVVDPKSGRMETIHLSNFFD